MLTEDQFSCMRHCKRHKQGIEYVRIESIAVYRDKHKSSGTPRLWTSASIWRTLSQTSLFGCQLLSLSTNKTSIVPFSSTTSKEQSSKGSASISATSHFKVETFASFDLSLMRSITTCVNIAKLYRKQISMLCNLVKLCWVPNLKIWPREFHSASSLCIMNASFCACDAGTLDLVHHCNYFHVFNSPVRAFTHHIIFSPWVMVLDRWDLPNSYSCQCLSHCQGCPR